MATINNKQLDNQTKSLADKLNAGINRAVDLASSVIGFTVQNEARKIHTEKQGKNVKIREVLPNTGNLRENIKFQIDKVGNGRIIRVISGARYGAMQEFGGTVRPVKARALFIPLSRKGKLEGPQRSTSPKKADLVWGKDFVLTQKPVTIPAKPYMRPALDNTRDKILRILIKEVEIQLSKV